MAEVYIARQAVFDSDRRVVGYELLHRSGPTNRFPAEVDAVTATARVLSDSLFHEALGSLTAGRPAFVNFDRDALLGGYATLLPAASTVVELLEDVDADEQVVAACRRLREQGYRLALDDVKALDDRADLFALADIVKVDFRAADGPTRRLLARRVAEVGSTLLAEKVETDAEFRQAAELGYELFQGYFLAEPQLSTGKALDVSRFGHLQVLQALTTEPLDFGEVAAALRRDGALTDRLMRYIHSAAFRWRHEIRTVEHALVLLGEDATRKWVTVSALAALATDKPAELFRTALLRAHMSEALAAPSRAGAPVQLFLTGLYTLLDALLDVPLRQALRRAPLGPDGRAALLGRPNRSRQLLDAVIGYERGDWESAGSASAALGLPLSRVSQEYRRALTTVDDLSEALTASSH